MSGGHRGGSGSHGRTLGGYRKGPGRGSGRGSGNTPLERLLLKPPGKKRDGSDTTPAYPVKTFKKVRVQFVLLFNDLLGTIPEGEKDLPAKQVVSDVEVMAMVSAPVETLKEERE